MVMIAFICFRHSYPNLTKAVGRRYVSSLLPISRQTLQTKAIVVSQRSALCCRLRPVTYGALIQRHYGTSSQKWDTGPDSEKDSTDGRPPRLRSVTTFHASDGLRPTEWTLIYHNREYERYKNFIPPMIIVGVACLLFLTFTITLVAQDWDRLKFEKGDWLFLGWPVGVGLIVAGLTRYRRRFVLRIYQQRPSSKSDAGGKRRYCIVWLNWFLGRRRFFYDHAETSGAAEHHAAIATFFGNFKAKKRAWHVKAANFERPQDYFNVRVASDIADVK